MGIRNFADLTGVVPIPGGQHAGFGTANYLVGLSGASGDNADSYLEIIGPDPAQPTFVGPRLFGVNRQRSARLATWAVRVANLDRSVADIHASGYDPGHIREMSRANPGGDRLKWRLTVRPGTQIDPVVPFLIEWEATSHPSDGDLPRIVLESLTATHPAPSEVQRELSSYGVRLDVTTGSAGLQVTISTPNGRVTLR